MTIKSLARELHLSPGTVSKALNNSHEISAETKQKVLALAAKLNYSPNPYASSLRVRKSKTIAVVLPEVADSFFSFAINGIESVAQEKGYHVLIYLTHEHFQKEKAILGEFKNGRVDGILLSVSDETRETRHIKELQAAGIPVVFFDRAPEDIKAAKVVTNDFESGYQAAAHLIARGCKRITYISTSKYLSISTHRMEGYKKALNDRLSPAKMNVLHCSSEEDSNQLLIKKLLHLPTRPDGLIASVEKLITPIYQACRELQLSIPGDIKVIGFSNLPSAFILNPSLTTIRQPAFEMGRAAMDLLCKALAKKKPAVPDLATVIPSALFERNSTSLTGNA